MVCGGGDLGFWDLGFGSEGFGSLVLVVWFWR